MINFYGRFGILSSRQYKSITFQDDNNGNFSNLFPYLQKPHSSFKVKKIFQTTVRFVSVRKPNSTYEIIQITRTRSINI